MYYYHYLLLLKYLFFEDAKNWGGVGVDKIWDSLLQVTCRLFPNLEINQKPPTNARDNDIL